MEMATHMGMDWGWDLTPLPGIVHPAHQQTSVWLKDGTVSCMCPCGFVVSRLLQYAQLMDLRTSSAMQHGPIRQLFVILVIM